MLGYLIPLMAVALVIIVLANTSKNKKKVDKGFKFNYYRLSYRRKMLRTLINLPIFILLLLVMYYLTDWSMQLIIVVSLLFLTGVTIQFVFNYIMWKRHENS